MSSVDAETCHPWELVAAMQVKARSLMACWVGVLQWGETAGVRLEQWNCVPGEATATGAVQPCGCNQSPTPVFTLDAIEPPGSFERRDAGTSFLMSWA